MLCTSGCRKLDTLDDLEASGRDAEYAIPLFSTSLSVEDILSEFDSTANITIDPDGMIFLNYKGDVRARTSSDIFDIAGQLDGLPLPVLDTLFALPFEVPSGIDLDYAILKTGTFEYLWLNEHPESFKFVFTLPNVTNPEGKVFSDTVNVPAGVTSYRSPEFDLSSYTVRPEEDSLYVHYEVIKFNGTKDTIGGLAIIIRDFVASYIEGYMGNEIYEMERDTIEMGFLGDEWRGDEFFFADPRLRMTVINSFGFPVRSKANLVNVISRDGSILPLRSEFLDAGIDFAYPLLSEVGEVKTTVFDFTRDNSNIDSILAIDPIAVDYDLEAIPNPDLDTTIRGFMTDTSFFQVQVEVEIPVYGRSKGFAVSDTLSFDMSQYADAEEAEFKLVTENEMPLDIDLQIFFADPQGLILDSLFLEGRPVVGSALVDEMGDVIEKNAKTHFIPLDAVRIDRILEAEQLYLNANFITYDQGQQSVTLLANQEVRMRMGMKVKID